MSCCYSRVCRAWCLGQEMFCRGRRHSLCRVTVVLLSLHWVLCKSHFCRAVRMCQDTPGSPGLPWLGSAVWCCLQKTIAVNSQNRGLLFPFSKHQKDLEHLPVVTLLALPQLPPSLQHRCPRRRALCAPSCSVPHHGAHPSNLLRGAGFNLCAQAAGAGLGPELG